jgi:dihydroflavonol-4-reductase
LEDDWNDAAGSWYSAGKTATERAAWAAAEEHGLDLTTILPSMTTGPVLPGQQPSSSNARLLHIARDSARKGITFGAFGVVDVRDVADAHVQALLLHSAVGERYIVSLPNQYTTKELAEVATAVAPSEAVRVRIGTGYTDPSYDSFTPRKPSTLNAKAIALLGRDLRPIQDTISDALVSFEREGCFEED